LGKKGIFTIKSVYNALTENETGLQFKHIWTGKIPAKINFFMWLMENGALLTKDNLIRRKWIGSPDCYLCECNESIGHLFFTCSIAKVIWACIAKCLGAYGILVNLG
jgi:hypothetical protein